MDITILQIKTVKNLSDLDFEPQDFDVVYCTDTYQFMIYQEEWRPLSIISGANYHNGEIEIATRNKRFIVTYDPIDFADAPERQPTSLKEAKCKNCGSPLDMVGPHNYHCSYCGSNYIYD